MKLRELVVASLAIFSLLSGCAGVGKQLDPPRISLANINVQEVTGFETAFQIQLRVFNANDVDLNVRGIKAELEINGQPFATGVSNEAVKIPSYGTELVTVTVYSSVIKMFKSIYGLKEAEELKYRLDGKISVSGNNMLPTTLPFESEGQVTLNPAKVQP
jgi:LEA14-like dessication related protein